MANVPGARPIEPPKALEGLEEWAARHGVLERLDDPVYVLAPYHGSSGFELRGCACLRDICRKAATAGLGARHELPRALAAVASHLFYHATLAEAKGARAAAWNRPLAPPALQGFANRLRERLAECEAAHRFPLFVYRSAVMAVSEDPPEVRVTWKLDTGWQIAAALDLTDPSTTPTVSCNCRMGPWCVHRRILLEWTLDALHDDSKPLRAMLVDMVSGHRWVGFLNALKKRRAPTEERVADHGALAWLITRGPGDPVRIEPRLVRKLKSGKWGKATTTHLSTLVANPAGLLSPQDSAVAGALLLHQAAYYPSRTHEHLLRALEHLDGHPKVIFEQGDMGPCNVRRERAAITLAQDAEGHYRIAVRLASTTLFAGERTESAIVGTRHLVIIRSGRRECIVSDVGERAVEFLHLAARFAVTLPEESHSELLDFLVGLQPQIDIDLPPAICCREHPPDHRPVIRIDPEDQTAPTPGLRARIGFRPAANGTFWPPGQGPACMFVQASGERVRVTRDFELEARVATDVAARTGFAFAPPNWDIFLAGDHAMEFLFALGGLGSDVAVEWPEPARRWRVSRTVELRVRVRAVEDWFGLEADADADGDKVPLSALLEAARSGRRYVQVGPERFAVLAKEVFDRVMALDNVSARHGNSGLRIPRARVLELQELFPSAGELSGDETWMALCRRIAQASAAPVQVPDSLTASLRPYQVQGFEWLARLSAWDAGACLADDMGLGKTVQTLALLVSRAERGPALVVAPTSVGFNWLEEAARFAPSLRLHHYRGANRGTMLEQLGPGHVIVTSYDILSLDIDQLASIHFGTLVLDEAQAIKNAGTRRARAARRLDADFRMALSGTPVENHLGELWSLFQVIVPGLLGSWEQFRDQFARPIELEKSADRQAALRRLLRPFLLRRTKSQVAPELPARTEVVESVEQTSKERALYRAVRRLCLEELSQASGSEQEKRFILLAAITRLRRLACNPRLHDNESTVASSKLTALMGLLANLAEQGGRALVFSQFTGHLAIVREELDRCGRGYLYLDGATPADQRARAVKTWAQGREELFLISLKAGGTGLNLTGADLVIHLDPWWNPAVEDQATDRTHRIGQTRPVTVVRLIAQGTIEEAVIGLHARKRELAQVLFEGAERAGVLSSEELADLIRWGEGESDVEGEDERAAPADVSLSTSVEATDPGPHELVDRLRIRLETELKTGRISSTMTLQGYGRAARRFLSFVEQQSAAGASRATCEDWIEAYGDALCTGAFAAPSSEPLVWRAVAGRMKRLIADGP